MKIKHIGYVAVLAAALPLAGNVARATNLPASGWLVGEPGQYHYSDGGEFLVTASANQSLTPSVQFTTFCIEVNNEFAEGDLQTYTLGQGTHDNPTGTSPLRLGTAYLFNLFASGQITIGSSTQAGEFQQALWDFQGQGAHFSGPGFDEGPQIPTLANPNNPYYWLAVSALGAGNVENDSNGRYGVEVVECDDTANGHTGQDWLVQVPDGSMTAMLLGGALVGVGALRRKLAA